MRSIIIILMTILTTVTLARAQNNLECFIHFPDTLILGQSMYFEYTIQNMSRKSNSVYYDPFGANFNNFRRDESFTIKVIDPNKVIVPIKESKKNEIIAFNRRTGYRELLKEDSLTYIHWIDNWVDLDMPGEYSIECSKEFHIKKGRKQDVVVTESCSKTFHVISFDSLTIANKVKEIWMNATIKKKEPPLIQMNQTRSEFLERRNQRTQNHKYRQNQLELLSRLNTEQIIPYLDIIMSTSKNTEDIHLAMEGLSKFSTNNEAFIMVSKPFEYKKDRFTSGVAKEELLDGLLSNLKLSSLHQLSEFEDSQFVEFILKHQKDESYSVRLYIMQQLYRMNNQYSYDNIVANLNDKNATIRSEAKMLLEMYEQKKKE